jgi:hypothetical protein
MSLPRYRLRTLPIVVAVAAGLMALLPIVWGLVSLDFVDDGYAQWGAGDLVVAYMKDHGGRWPRGWGDLKPYFVAGGGHVAGFTLEDYRRRVTIDWDADPAALEAAAKANPRPIFRVVTPRHAWAGTIEGNEPNQIVYDYLRSRPARPGG